MSEPCLNPCPKCGRTSNHDKEPVDKRVVLCAEGTPELREWQVRCRNCGLRGPFKKSEEKAVFYWNCIEIIEP